MNFNALIELREQSQALHARRHQSASDAYAQGLKFFEKALQTQFQDKQALKYALELWFTAMKTHRQNPKASIGVGYIFMILGDRVQAMRYFKNAESIQPDSADAKLFIEALSAPVFAVKETSLQETELNYAQTEQLLVKHQKWLKTQPSTKPVIDSEAYAALQERAQKENTLLVKASAQIQQLAAITDTCQLDIQFYQIEKAYQLTEKALRFSDKFIVLAEEIQKIENSIGPLFALLKQNRAQALQVLEQMLDHCDKIADQLDDIEAQGVSISLLEAPYSQLLQRVGLLQENFDEWA